jgi:hypothetical protein
MSKRKNRSQSPNIPQSTLDRARQQLGEPVGEPVESEPEVKVEKSARVVEAAAPVRPTTTRSAAPRARSTRPAGGAARAPRKDEKHDISYIRARLANPTRVVTETDLKAEYGYVVKDLRWMGALAAILIAALVVIEKII